MFSKSFSLTLFTVTESFFLLVAPATPVSTISSKISPSLRVTSITLEDPTFFSTDSYPR
jgi:hypothetical protein